MYDPQSLLDNHKVMLNHLCPVLDITNLLYGYLRLANAPSPNYRTPRPYRATAVR